MTKGVRYYKNINKMKKKNIDKVIELLSGIGMDVWGEDIKDIENVDELRDYLEDNNLFDDEIIYHARAMEYLSENDPSLQFSLEIAEEYGYELSSLSSELLATLHASKKRREDYEEIVDELSELISK